jgi:8-oxo-dGTP diphosphatase
VTQRKGKRHSAEQAFLADYDPNEFERPSLTTDVVLLSVHDGALKVAVVKREQQPQQGMWGLPGGFVGIRESLDAAASRVLAEKAGLRQVFLEQLYTFGDPRRDPRTRVVTVAYYALVDPGRLEAVERRGVTLGMVEVPWSGEAGGRVAVYDGERRRLALAFDHAEIIGTAIKRIRGKLDYTPIGFQLLPRRFTLRRLQDVHETILGTPTNKDSFRRRMLASGQLQATGEQEADVGHRPAELYRFIRRSAV